MSRYLFLLLVGPLGACVTTEGASRRDLESEVASAVKNGMPVAEVVSTLGVHGFSCEESADTQGKAGAVFECMRRRGPKWPPQTCTHTVRFKQGAKGTISNLEVLEPACVKG